MDAFNIPYKKFQNGENYGGVYIGEDVSTNRSIHGVENTMPDHTVNEGAQEMEIKSKQITSSHPSEGFEETKSIVNTTPPTCYIVENDLHLKQTCQMKFNPNFNSDLEWKDLPNQGCNEEDSIDILFGAKRSKMKRKSFSTLTPTCNKKIGNSNDEHSAGTHSIPSTLKKDNIDEIHVVPETSSTNCSQRDTNPSIPNELDQGEGYDSSKEHKAIMTAIGITTVFLVLLFVAVIVILTRDKTKKPGLITILVMLISLKLLRTFGVILTSFLCFDMIRNLFYLVIESFFFRCQNMLVTVRSIFA